MRLQWKGRISDREIAFNFLTSEEFASEFVVQSRPFSFLRFTAF
jgi:hypothetical protein